MIPVRFEGAERDALLRLIDAVRTHSTERRDPVS
jgi:hypothetical protein